MADYTDVKKGQGSVYPTDAYDAGGGPDRVEPILTPQVLKDRFLFGIPLVNPFNPKEKVTSAMLRDFIKRGIAQVEMDTKTTVSPVLRRVRLPFDPNLYYNNIWCEIPYKPVQKVLKLAIQSASYKDGPQENDRYPAGNQIYQIPNQWIDMSYAPHGKIFVNPINPAFAAVGFTTAAQTSGATILQFIGIQGWVPAYWTVECEVGFCSPEGNVPVYLNEAIGAKATILLLDTLIPMFRVSSQSLSLDGQGQSASDDMQRLLKQKRDDLVEAYKGYRASIKTHIGANMFVSNI
jgi:hypothetical protein